MCYGRARPCRCGLVDSFVQLLDMHYRPPRGHPMASLNGTDQPLAYTHISLLTPTEAPSLEKSNKSPSDASLIIIILSYPYNRRSQPPMPSTPSHAPLPRALVATLGLGLVSLLVSAAAAAAAAEQQRPSVFNTLPFEDERLQGPQVCMCSAFKHQQAIRWPPFPLSIYSNTLPNSIRCAGDPGQGAAGLLRFWRPQRVLPFVRRSKFRQLLPQPLRRPVQECVPQGR